MTQPTTILAISSRVAVGHVGLSAIEPTLHALGIDVIAMPTVILSNHPGFAHAAGTRITPATLAAMLDALAANGFLAQVGTVLSGYLPTADHAAFVITAVARVRAENPSAIYVCDPVLGDDPKGLYIDPAAAAAIQRDLVPRADILLPNRFELAWLTGHPVNNADQAITAARSLGVPRIIAKSIPSKPAPDGPAHGPDHLTVLDIRQAASEQHKSAPGTTERFTIEHLAGVPNGTGDMFSALIAAGLPLSNAVAAVQCVIEQSLGAPHLAITTGATAWQVVAAGPQPLRSADPDLIVTGVDGCPAGWIAVSHPLDAPERASWRIYPTFAELLTATAHHAAIAIDMPIGLPDIAEPGGRQADREARAVLGARQSSVFAVPSRAAIACTDYREACAAALAHSSPPRKVARQTFNLFPKIREIDALMTPSLQRRIVECHPEIAFWAMTGKRALTEPKKVRSSPYPPGLALRRHLLAVHGYTAEFLAGPDCPRRHAAPDDFLDACAAAWSAARHAAGRSERFPAQTPLDASSLDAQPLDSHGLRMEIVY